jgi:hypothetical protein
MKKIGIITLFGYNNYGNRLQMYATQKVYKNLGLESEVIKFNQEVKKDPFIIKVKVFIMYLLLLRTNLRIAFFKKYRENNFKRHAKKHISESNEYINPLQIEANFHEKYSFLSVGSDQIWGWFNHTIADFIFLKFAPTEKRIAFSPSFGSATIANQYAELFMQGLQGFTDISVREASGAEIVKKLTSKEATVLCDPTMCLSKEEWLQFANSHKKKPSTKYILTYFLGEKAAKVEALLATLSNNYEIINLNNLNDSKYYAITPSEWVDYINDASLFLTDSFHGVVFSIVLKTPFAIYSRVGGETMQTRITNILEKFQMENRFEITETDASFFKMDFSSSDEIINAEKAKTFAFLQKAINL